MNGIAQLFTQTASVETYQGSGTFGDVFAAPATKVCFVTDGEKLVRNGQGDQVVSSTKLYGPITDADAYKPGSRVTIPGRGPASVIAMLKLDQAGPANVHHVEVSLT